MLIEFAVENFKSFRERQALSLVAGRDKAHPGNTIEAGGEKLLKAAALYGANASGKSNLLQAMGVMRDLVLSSATRMTMGDELPVSPFRLNPAMVDRPSCFRVVVQIEGVTYDYSFAATSNRVTAESLFVRKPKGRRTLWLDRQTSPSGPASKWKCSGPLERFNNELQSTTRINGLAFSRAIQLNVDALAPLFNWFLQRLFVLDMSLHVSYLTPLTAQRIMQSDELRRRVATLLKDTDVGIVDLHVQEEPLEMKIPPTATDAEKKLASRLQAFHQLLSDGAAPRVFRIRTLHEAAPGRAPCVFHLDSDESMGTQRVFAIAGPLLDALDVGATVVVDELDCSLHPHLTRKLIELMQDEKTNSKGAQLIFATHDSSIMDSSLFRRDQIWLTEKRRDGSTDLFSLYDIDQKSRPRKTEALEKNYLEGRYGGVPNFGPSLEDATVR